MKTLKFAENLVSLVLSGEKTSTWRLFDDKDLSIGDELILINQKTGGEFARGRVIAVREKSLGDITDSDFGGHERFESREKMFGIYREYYGDRVTEDTTVKMIDFELF